MMAIMPLALVDRREELQRPAPAAKPAMKIMPLARMDGRVWHRAYCAASASAVVFGVPELEPVASKPSCRSNRTSIAPPLCSAAPASSRCCCAWAKRSPACMSTARKPPRKFAPPALWRIRPILRAASAGLANRPFDISRKRRQPRRFRPAPVLFRFRPAERPPSPDRPSQMSARHRPMPRMDWLFGR